GLLLVIGAVAIHTLSPLLVHVFSSARELGTVAPAWFGLMLLLEVGSFAAAWGLTRLAVPGLTWGVAAMAQLAANGASRVFPGGAVVGTGLYYSMLARSGIEAGQAAAALTTNSLISTMVLFALPAVAAGIAVFSVPLPAGLVPVAIGGLVVFAALLVAGFLTIRFDAPLRWATRGIGAVAGWVAALRHRTVKVSARTVLERRDKIVKVLGPNWYKATALAATNWLLDYLVLVVALRAVGANPRLSIVLLAYAAAAVLSMIPITPGGLGFVEAGLTATLAAAGVPAGSALLATLGYRLIGFWLPIPAGGISYLVFRRKYGKPVEAAEG
ncbi:MAG: flippase-like domain-containing protein, partial [Acidimicrobiia bacterium]|nr:flippase-like domain-containing protein [Acidimicrobiia bacterium]